MKKYVILMVGVSMLAIGTLLLGLTGCRILTSGDTLAEGAPRVAEDLAYGYQLIHVGELFPDTALTAPKSPTDRSYLGLDSDSAFSVSDIDADLVLVVMLNSLCAPCQAQAPVYSDLFDAIESDNSSADSIKMLAVAVGNSEEEIESFRQAFKVPFPVIPDQGFDLHAAVGEPRLPFSVLVRLADAPVTAMVALTYTDVSDGYEILYQDMAALETLDLDVFRERGAQAQATVYTVKQPLSQAEIQSQVKNAMAGLGGRDGRFAEFQKLALGDRQVYTGVIESWAGKNRLFAEVVSRPTLCNVCHDVHFFYIFNEKGMVVDFVPLQLTKWGNEMWSEQDIQLMRDRLKGRFIFTPFYFNSQLDAVTSATITSMLIYQELSQGRDLFEALRQKGLIPSEQETGS